MPVTGFNHYNLCADRIILDKLRDFYINVIGLQLGYRPPFEQFGYWLYIGDQPILHLSEAPQEEARPLHVISTFDHVAFTCVDRLAMEAQLQQHQVQFKRAEIPRDGNSQLFFSDPAGNKVELNFAKIDA